MARTDRAKTAREVEALAKTPGKHRVDAGLYLQTRGDRVSWLHRYTFAGRPRYSGLGAYPETTLAEARGKCRDEQSLLRKGVDPVEERKRKRAEKAAEEKPAAPTFRKVATAYIADNESAWKNPVHRTQWRATLARYAYPAIGDKAVNEITTDDVYQVLKPIWHAKPETARRLRGRIEKVLGAAKARGWRSGENPARLADNIALLFPRPEKRKVRHHPAMPYAQIPVFMAELRRHEATAAKALEFVILTAVRTGDIIGQKGRDDDRPPMKWAHVDLEAQLWTIPATKTDAEHKVPLSDRAMAVLHSVKGRDPEIVFPSPDRKGEPLSNNAMLALLARMERSDCTTHGMRSAFRDWAAECTNFPREVAEKALAHAIEDEVEAAYRRGELLRKRRHLMAAWGAYCTSQAAGKVVRVERIA
jgi:integrase